MFSFIKNVKMKKVLEIRMKETFCFDKRETFKRGYCIKRHFCLIETLLTTSKIKKMIQTEIERKVQKQKIFENTQKDKKNN